MYQKLLSFLGAIPNSSLGTSQAMLGECTLKLKVEPESHVVWILFSIAFRMLNATTWFYHHRPCQEKPWHQIGSQKKLAQLVSIGATAEISTAPCHGKVLATVVA